MTPGKGVLMLGKGLLMPGAGLLMPGAGPRSGGARSRVALGLLVLLLGAAARGSQSVDLTALYLRAVEFDPAFLAARSERRIADEVLRESRAGMLPVLSASASGSYTIQDIRSTENPAFFRVGETDYYSEKFSIILAQPIYRSATLARIDEAHAEVRRAESLYQAAEQDLMMRIAEAYLASLAARDSLDFATSEREAIGRQLEEAEERLGSGLAKITDVQDARGRYALAQAAEIDARDALEEGRRAVAEITGEFPADLKVLSDSLPLVHPDSPDVARWVETATFQNPRVRALEAALDIAREQVRRQRAAYRPTLELVASYNDSDTGGTIYGDAGGNAIDTQELELRLAIPILDGGRNAAQVAAASLRQNVAGQELERERRNVDRKTRAAFQGVVSGITRVESLRESVFAHEAALVAKEEGWRSGVSAALAVLDARRELFRSRRDLARARYLYILDGLKLKQFVGILGVGDLEQVNAYLQ
jgi:outer membrane protein